MNIKNKHQTKKAKVKKTHHRSLEARFSAALVAAATVFAVAEAGHHGAVLLKAAKVEPSFVFDSAAESEVERMPVRFEEGLHVQGITGL